MIIKFASGTAARGVDPASGLPFCALVVAAFQSESWSSMT